jgi:hypothetical protein
MFNNIINVKFPVQDVYDFYAYDEKYDRSMYIDVMNNFSIGGYL